jgi:hypothetical protein
MLSSTFSLSSVPARAQTDPDPIGSEDSITGLVIQGWACDASDYNAPIMVDFYDGPFDPMTGGSNYIGSAKANESSANGSIGCNNSSNHGFTYVVPQFRSDGQPLQDGLPHAIYAYAIGIDSNDQLNGSNPSLKNSGSIVLIYTDDGGTAEASVESGGMCGRFQDVYTGDYYYEGTQFMGCRLVVGGYPCGAVNEPCYAPDYLPYFRPYNFVTRGQLAKIVILSHGIYGSQYNGPRHFTDVATDNPFYNYVELAYQFHIIVPTSGVNWACPTSPLQCTFSPFNRATRAEAAGAIVAAAQYTFNWPLTPSFSDVPTSNYYYGYIEIGYARGLFTGYNDGTFRPTNYLTRGQLVKMDTNARFYHQSEGSGGYNGPYTGSPNLDQPTNTTPLLRTIPSAWMNGERYYDGTNNNDNYRAYNYHMLYTQAAKDSLVNALGANQIGAVEFSAEYGLCANGSFQSRAYSNLPGSQLQNLGSGCEIRLYIYNPSGILANVDGYYSYAIWSDYGGHTSSALWQMKTHSTLIDRTWFDTVLHGDWLADFCYKNTVGVTKCP